MEHEALIFLHVPKTAGTTLNRIIEWQYNPVSIFTVDPHRIRATAARFKTFPEERRRRLRVVRGHLVFGIHEFLPQGAVYITMLREPVARLLSSYHFILRRPLSPVAPEIKGGRAQRGRSYSINASSSEFAVPIYLRKWRRRELR